MVRGKSPGEGEAGGGAATPPVHVKTAQGTPAAPASRWGEQPRDVARPSPRGAGPRARSSLFSRFSSRERGAVTGGRARPACPAQCGAGSAAALQWGPGEPRAAEATGCGARPSRDAANGRARRPQRPPPHRIPGARVAFPQAAEAAPARARFHPGSRALRSGRGGGGGPRWGRPGHSRGGDGGGDEGPSPRA